MTSDTIPDDIPISESTMETRDVFPLRRPVTMVACARFGARRYCRERDLPGAVPGLLAGRRDAILPRLIVEERRCEEARLARCVTYRPARHVQILSALLAEAAARSGAGARKTRTTAPTARARPVHAGTVRHVSTSARAIRLEARAARPCPAVQVKASGSDSLRLVT